MSHCGVLFLSALSSSGSAQALKKSALLADTLKMGMSVINQGTATSDVQALR
jgi:hypothetical protein